MYVWFTCMYDSHVFFTSVTGYKTRRHYLLSKDLSHSGDVSHLCMFHMYVCFTCIYISRVIHMFVSHMLQVTEPDAVTF